MPATFIPLETNVGVLNMGGSTSVELCRIVIDKPVSSQVISSVLPTSFVNALSANVRQLISNGTSIVQRQRPEFAGLLLDVMHVSGTRTAYVSTSYNPTSRQLTVSVVAANSNDSVLVLIPTTDEAGYVFRSPPVKPGTAYSAGDGIVINPANAISVDASIPQMSADLLPEDYEAGKQKTLVLQSDGKFSLGEVSGGGGGSVDLSGYATKTYVDTGLAAKAATGHNHDDAYAAKTHSHDTAYAGAGHNHDTAYLKLDDVVTYAAKPAGGLVVEADESNADQRLLSVDSKVVRVSEAPVTTGEDAGKVPVVQENGSYALQDAGSVAGVIPYTAKADGGLVLSDVSETDPALGREFSLDGSVPRLAFGALDSDKVIDADTQALVIDSNSNEVDGRYEFKLVSVATKEDLAKKADATSVPTYDVTAGGGLVRTGVMSSDPDPVLTGYTFGADTTFVRVSTPPNKDTDKFRAVTVSATGAYEFTDVATQDELEAVSAGIKYKNAVEKRVASVADIAGAGLTTGQRVLVDSGTAALANGIYEKTAGGYVRASDFDGVSAAGAYVFVRDADGSGNGASYICTTAAPNDIAGTNNLAFTQYAAGKTYSALANGGLTLSSANAFSVNFAKYDAAAPTDEAKNDFPLMDGTRSPGSGNAAARWNHVHPSDTSRLATSGGQLTGVVTYDAPSSNKLTDTTAPPDPKTLATIGYVATKITDGIAAGVPFASTTQAGKVKVSTGLSIVTDTALADLGKLSVAYGTVAGTAASGDDARLNLPPATAAATGKAAPNAIPYVTPTGTWGALAAPQLATGTEMSLTARRGSTAAVSLEWAGPYAKLTGGTFTGQVSFAHTEPPTTSANIPADSNNTTLVTSAWVNTKLTSSITSVARGFATVTAAITDANSKYLTINTTTTGGSATAPQIVAQIGTVVGSLADGGDTRFNVTPDGDTPTQTTAARGAIAYVGALGGIPANTTNRWYRLTPPSGLTTPFLGFDAAAPTGPAPKWRDLSTEISTALPIATTSALGAIKIGTGLTMANGTASVDFAGYATTTSVNAQATKYDKSYTYDLSWSDPAPVPSASGVESYSMIHVAVRAFTIKPSLSKGGSVGRPSVDTTFTLQKWTSVDTLRLNGTPAASITVTIDSSGTAAFSSALDISVAAGNVITLRCPNTTVNSLTNLFLTLACEPA